MPGRLGARAVQFRDLVRELTRKELKVGSNVAAAKRLRVPQKIRNTRLTPIRAASGARKIPPMLENGTSDRIMPIWRLGRPSSARNRMNTDPSTAN